MLQSNLIGRQFKSTMSGTVYTIVGVYITDKRLWLVGEDEKGRLTETTTLQVELIPTSRGADENLTGII